MNLLRTTEFRVGLLVTVVLTLLAVMIIQVSEDPSLHGRTRDTWFSIDDASGLVKNSQVRMAGIGVGVIKQISLEDGRARVDLTIRKDIPITASTAVEIRANGILGDKHIEIVRGNPGDSELTDGAPIPNVRNNGSMDEVMKKVGTVTDSLNEVAVALKNATTGQGDKTTTIGRVLMNLDLMTADLAEFTHGNKQKISNIVNNLEATTGTINQLVNDESDEGFKAGWASAVSSLHRIDRSLTNVEEITEKVNSGKGTLGKLVNDEETVTEINKAVAGVNQFLGGANKIQTNIDVHSEYLADANLFKSYASVRIQPGLNRYYELGVVMDPKGVVETTQTQTSSVPGGPTASDPTVTEKKTYQNRVKFTGLYAMNFYDFTVKGGLIESSGGVGLDYYLMRRKLRLSTEIFDVKDSTARLRSSLRYNFIKGLYLTGGGDDMLSSKNVSSYIGAGLDLTNDDLKSLMSFLF